jgi:Uma2 family endonuclease
LLPKGGKYQADGFAFPAREWAKVPIDLINSPYPPAFPTAAFELLSPANVTTTGYTIEFTKKLADYEASAVPLVVLLNPKNEHAIIRRPGRPEETSSAKILAFAELPGLELDAGEIYDDCNNRFAFEPRPDAE